MSFELLSGSFPVAKKAHKCVWCGEEIKIGEKHYKFVGLNDGDFQSSRLHNECWDAMKRDMNQTEEHEYQIPEGMKRGLAQGEITRTEVIPNTTE